MSNPPPSDLEPPPLTADVVADDDALAEAVDTFISGNAEAKERLRQIVAMQDALRVGVDVDVWQLALHIDEMVTERWADLVVEVGRWAFNEGVRSAAQRQGAT